jgi:hypothetical protein
MSRRTRPPFQRGSIAATAATTRPKCGVESLLYDGEAASIGAAIAGIQGLREADGRPLVSLEATDVVNDELERRIAVEQAILDDLVESYYGVELPAKAA